MPMELEIVGRSFAAGPESTVATILRLDGERLVIRSPTPAAPGTRLATRLRDGRELRLKVDRCIRRDDHFELDTRMVDPPATLRRTIEAALGDPPAPGAAGTTPGGRAASGS
jgi:hypothetical protein